MSSSIPTRVRNSTASISTGSNTRVPAYLQGFETNLSSKIHHFLTTFQHTYKGSKRNCIGGTFYDLVLFQHTYKGSKPSSFILFSASPYMTSSSIPTRVRNSEYQKAVKEKNTCSSIPTRVRNKPLVNPSPILDNPVPAYLQGFETRASSMRRWTSTHVFQHTYKGSKLMEKKK